MPQRIPSPLPKYEVGDHVVIRLGEDRASRIVRGKVDSLTWSRLMGDYLYGITVSGPEGEEPKLTIVRQCEIWGLIIGDADSAVSAEA